jgi:DNA-binding NtrC family response regulator
MKILIVEDDRNYRFVLYELLHLQGHDILVVSDALHAVALLDERDNGIELVLLDLRMPRLSGDQVMETFAHWGDCRARFIIMSGHVDPTRFKDHPKVVGCLQKPIEGQVLINMINKAGKLMAEEKKAAEDKAAPAG